MRRPSRCLCFTVVTTWWISVGSVESTAPTQSTNFSGSRELDVLLARCRAAVTSAARGSVTDAKGTPVNLDNESANDVITELLRACKAVNDQEAEHQEHSFRDAAAGEFAHETLAQACPLRQIPPDYHERVQAHALNNGSGSNRYVCHNNGALPPPLKPFTWCVGNEDEYARVKGDNEEWAWAPVLLKLSSEILKENCVRADGSRALVVDVGAHLGYFTLAAASYGCRVIAFEPSPDVADRLSVAVAANGLTHLVQVVVCAVHSEPIHGLMLARPFHGSTLSTRTLTAAEMEARGWSSKVSYGTVTGIPFHIHVREPILIFKVDCEGCELAVFQSATEQLRQTQYVFTEISWDESWANFTRNRAVLSLFMGSEWRRVTFREDHTLDAPGRVKPRHRRWGPLAGPHSLDPDREIWTRVHDFTQDPIGGLEDDFVFSRTPLRVDAAVHVVTNPPIDPDTGVLTVNTSDVAPGGDARDARIEVYCLMSVFPFQPKMRRYMAIYGDPKKPPSIRVHGAHDNAVWLASHNIPVSFLLGRKWNSVVVFCAILEDHESNPDVLENPIAMNETVFRLNLGDASHEIDPLDQGSSIF